MADGLFNPVTPDIYDRLDALGVAIPKPATLEPMAERVGASIGTATARFALEDHQHPRLTSTTTCVLDASGLATVPFTRTFNQQPGVVMTEVNSSSNQPLILVVQSFVQSNGVYTGAIVKGFRSQPLPSQSQLSVASLLTGVVTSLNGLASSLTGFNVFGGSAAGSQVSVVAIMRSDMPPSS